MELFIKHKNQIFAVKIADSDVELVKQYKYHISKNGNKNPIYYVRRWDKTVEPKQAIALAHDIYVKHFGEIPSGFLVDHIDGDTLNNYPDNLREATVRQNRFNSKGNITATSKFKGVCVHKDKFQVQINAGGKKYHLGHYDDEILAAKVYNAVAPLIHGEHAHLNEINN